MKSGCYYYMFKIFNGGRETPGVKWFKSKKKIFIKFGIIYLIKSLKKMDITENLEYKLENFIKEKRRTVHVAI